MARVAGEALERMSGSAAATTGRCPRPPGAMLTACRASVGVRRAPRRVGGDVLDPSKPRRPPAPRHRRSPAAPTPRRSTVRTTSRPSASTRSRDLGVPGKPPFTRGVQPNMYRGRLWTMRQYAGFGTAEESNERYRYLLEQGQTGPQRRVRPADADGARLGRPAGAAARSAASASRSTRSSDMRTPARRAAARQGLDVDDDQRDRGDPALPLRRGGRGERRAAARAPRHGPERHPQGVHGPRDVHLPAAPSLRLITDIFAFARAARCRSGTRSRSAATTSARRAATPPRRSRSRSPTASRTWRRRSTRGSTSTRSARSSRSSSTCTTTSSRRSRSSAPRAGCGRAIMNDRFGAKTDRARALRFHCQTAGIDAHRAAAAEQRGAGRRCRRSPRCSAAASRSTRTASTRRSACRRASRRRIALRTQQIIAHESGVADFVDAARRQRTPSRRSPTRSRRRRATYIARIDELGGMVARSSRATRSARSRPRPTSTSSRSSGGSALVVGQNAFMQDAPRAGARVDPKLEREQVERLRAVRARRAPRRPRALRWRRSRPPRAARTTSCRSCSKR